MYININFDHVNSHRAFIQEQNNLINDILLNVRLQKEFICESTSIEYYNKIVSDLELLRKSIRFRQELMENTITDFRQIMKREAEIISRINSLISSHGIGD